MCCVCSKINCTRRYTGTTKYTEKKYMASKKKSPDVYYLTGIEIAIYILHYNFVSI